MIHIANENISSPAYRSHLKAMGLLPGVPDYMILFEGGVAFIEIKRDKTCKMTKAQKIFTELLTVFNIPWICTYDKDKVIEFLTEVLDEKNEL